MNLNEMRLILTSGQIQLSKSLGQNFLHDGNQLRRMVEAAELTPADRVLEIGPGLGPLTELLEARAGEVLAIEKDRRLFEFLEKRFRDSRRLVLRCDDAIDFLRRERRDWTRWKLVANPPYSAASQLLVGLAQSELGPERIVVTLQWEVAQRLTAVAGDDDYGLLSLLMQLRYEPREGFRIPAGCFFPAPDVDSACVILCRRKTPLLPAGDGAVFDRIVKRGFSQRRKMMLKLLKQDWPADRLAAGFERLGLSPQVRAERVTLAQFVELTRWLTA
jgi:16S rRNA (adenine1518-N6/adenine1519-N6)-dimethyltransferase